MSKHKHDDEIFVPPDILDTIGHWLDLIGAAMGSDAGRLLMKNEFLRQLEMTGAATLPTGLIIAAAAAGNEAADLALRAYIADLINHHREHELTAQLRAYNVAALLRPAVHYPRGTSDTVDTWTRDIAIWTLVDLTARQWQLPPTRGHGSVLPSAAGYVAVVLRRRGFGLKKDQVSDIYRHRHGLAERIGATLFPRLGDGNNLPAV